MNSSQLKYGEIFCFLTLFFLILFLFLSNAQKNPENNSQALSSEVSQLKQDNARKEAQIKGLKTEVKGLENNKRGLEEAIAKLPLKDLPPNITIQNTGQFAFPLGQANLTTDLESYIDGEIVSKIKDYFHKYDINTIEVIGHTDGLEVSKTSNLDEILNKVATGNKTIKELQAGSNADLGLMRALAVIEQLQNEKELIQLFKNKGINKDKVFRAYSAAQLYLPNGKIAPSDPQANQERRRIEIRFTKLNYENKTKE